MHEYHGGFDITLEDRGCITRSIMSKQSNLTIRLDMIYVEDQIIGYNIKMTSIYVTIVV